MMVGSTWKAKMEPEAGAMTLPNAPALGRPSSPNRIRVPAKVAESMLVTTSPAQRHDALPEVEAQHQERERDLQAETPGNGAPANVAAVGRAQPGGGKHGENSQHSRKSTQWCS